mgnify:CR=1 FL=1
MTEIQKRTLIGCACAVSCETLFGLSYLFTKKITSDVDAVTLLGWRFTGVHHDEYFIGYRIYKYKHKEETFAIFAKDSLSSADSLFFM